MGFGGFWRVLEGFKNESRVSEMVCSGFLGLGEVKTDQRGIFGDGYWPPYSFVVCFVFTWLAGL